MRAIMIIYKEPWHRWFLRWLLPDSVSVRLVNRKGKALKPMRMKINVVYVISTQSICFSHVDDCKFFDMVQIDPKTMPAKKFTQSKLPIEAVIDK